MRDKSGPIEATTALERAKCVSKEEAERILVQAIMGGIDDFIDPPSVSGLRVLPSERRELAQCIKIRIEAFQHLGQEKIENEGQELRD